MLDPELKKLIDRLLITGCFEGDTKLNPDWYFPGEAQAASEEHEKAWRDMRAYLRKTVQGPSES